MVPTLGARRPFRVGESAEIRLTGALGHTIGLLMHPKIEVDEVEQAPLHGQRGGVSRAAAE
jgi:hypothetical protein